MIAAIIAPAGVRSIARMRACLVLDCIAGFADEGTDRVRDLGLLVFRGPERVLDLDLDLVMGSWQDPEARLSLSKSPQQRSDQARTPVNSEQYCGSYAQQGVVRKALSAKGEGSCSASLLMIC